MARDPAQVRYNLDRMSAPAPEMLARSRSCWATPRMVRANSVQRDRSEALIAAEVVKPGTVTGWTRVPVRSFAEI
jgi:hypothetical protein